MKKLIANCPFCGGQFLQISRQRRQFHVNCETCGSSGPHRLLFEDAIEEWNALSDSVAMLRQRRARPAPLAEQAH